MVYLLSRLLFPFQFEHSNVNSFDQQQMDKNTANNTK